MAVYKQFEDLEIWQIANDVAVSFYGVSETGQIKTDWGLKDQLRRSAASISNNIAEGFEYDNNPDFIRFLRYAKGSAGELRNQLIILKKIGFVTEEFYQEMYPKVVSLSKQIAGFRKYLIEFERKKKA